MREQSRSSQADITLDLVPRLESREMRPIISCLVGDTGAV